MNTPFDDKMDILNRGRDTRIPVSHEHTNDAAVYVVDTLDLAWKGARQTFGDKATPEIALAIYDRIEADRKLRAAERDRIRAEAKEMADVDEGPSLDF